MDDSLLADTENAQTPFITKIEGRLWGFVYVKSRTEKKLLAKLTAKKIPCYLPLLKKMRIHHRGKVFSEIPMFPSYLFICPDPSEILDIKCQSEVVGVTIVDDVLEESFIRELNIVRKFEILSQIRPTVVNPEIQPGSTVLVKKGPLKDTEVIVVKRLGEASIIANLHFLGQSCECKIPADELKLLL